jgi:hypothetical protein
MRSKPGAVAGLCALVTAASCADPFIESVSQLGDTRDPGGPYSVWVVVVGVEPDDRVELFYRVDDDAAEFSPLVMESVEVDDGAYEGELFARGIPGQPVGVAIGYYVAVARDGDRVAIHPEDGEARPFLFSVVP